VRGPSGALVRTELFVHGALCVAVSGQCHMSLAQYNASGNRGACYQSCRRRYRVTDAETGEEFVLENQFVMSPKDLCTVGHLDRIVRAGITVLKIEGRGRSADYVARTTRIYREALDDFIAQETERPGEEWPAPEKREGWVRALEGVFNRGFWQGGYYCGETPVEWAGVRGSQAKEVRVQLGRVSNYFARSGVMEFKSCQPEFKRGARMLVLGHTTGVAEFVAESLQVEGRPVEQAGMHEVVTVPVPVKVRRGDKVFELVERGGPPA
jgi:U32 family peptidase